MRTADYEIIQSLAIHENTEEHSDKLASMCDHCAVTTPRKWSICRFQISLMESCKKVIENESK
ncbi:MAG: hypothetical protein ACP5N7_05405 [Candidatus Pacearchaeota archaeon]